MKSQIRIRVLHPEFVEFIPAELRPGVLYISIPYSTASHLCACGCGHKVVTPIRPTDWSITWDGAAVSLCPSIGNWGLACRSHYWVRQGGRIEWAGSWNESMIAAARERGLIEKKRYFSRRRHKTKAGVQNSPRNSNA
jgi:Family of unknown function (DUF6527)